MHRKLTGVAFALMAAGAAAQLATPDPDWREVEAPPPPSLQTSGLVQLEMPRSELRYFVQPNSVSIGSDGIVRYVVVAMSATGAVNAMYEGLRCDRGEFRTYARHNPDQGWVQANTQWRPLNDGSNPARHNLEVARTGACIGHATNSSAEQIVRDLRAPVADRFRPELR